MRKNLLPFLLGCFATISFGAASLQSDLLTIKPSTPKSVLTVNCGTTEATELIKAYTKKGYILKGYYINSGYSANSVLVMEKY